MSHMVPLVAKGRAPMSRPSRSARGDAVGSCKDFFQERVPLGPFTTLQSGGTASKLTVCSTENQLLRAYTYAHDTGQTCMPLGFGSNALMFDFDGLIAINRVGGLRETLSGLPDSAEIQTCVLTVGAGQSLQQLAVATSSLGWSGLEFAAGIPASVGGAVRSNAGAHGQEMSSVVTAVSILDPEALSISHHRPRDEGWKWGYRCVDLPCPNGCITEVSISLDADPSAKERVREILAHRRATQPSRPSAGCMFKNPPSGETAGSLLERAGMKGVSVGGACVSEQHANFFVNSTRAALPDDFLNLITLARDAVWKQSAVLLQLEVKLVKQGIVLTSEDL